MALNLRKKLPKETTLYISDVSEAVIEKFCLETAGQGPVAVAATGLHAVQVADTVITMLPDSPAVKSVYLDSGTGILAGISAIAASKGPVNKMLIECGTIERATIDKVGAAVETCAKTLPAGSNLDFSDAPVSGGPMGAQAGTLAFMFGTNKADALFPKIKEILKPMGKESSIFPCGPVGAGVSFKVINNYISAITSLASSEALNIGVKLGYDPKTLTQVINASGGQNWIVSNSNPVPGVQENVPSSRNYEGGFRIELCKKVLEMGIELAEQAGARTVLDKPTLAAFEEAAADERYKGKDARVVYKWLSESRST
ncbi:putative 3-hydroxyisobutyrate dehydrogenase, mitochondrial [Pseudocercospora fuligena]|uniref:3-hydroxyisobutyrate dehydrogenase n=1 Tax=Pseudocercospora fuligena TaxID=685502 RepID=A0A8H6VPG6_9PEZI|nr:putative 3-hydroxyisobutyrate dehydrogenase, mitochondrial [Pseudocercospora fuligena]